MMKRMKNLTRNQEKGRKIGGQKRKKVKKRSSKFLP